jgi:hypothetical protein
MNETGDGRRGVHTEARQQKGGVEHVEKENK